MLLAAKRTPLCYSFPFHSAPLWSMVHTTTCLRARLLSFPPAAGVPAEVLLGTLVLAGLKV